jgi:hypothetical protein
VEDDVHVRAVKPILRRVRVKGTLYEMYSVCVDFGGCVRVANACRAIGFREIVR